MKRALEMVTAMELPADIVGALGAGLIGRDSFTGLCELVAQRAREEAFEMAAAAVECEACEARCLHTECATRKTAARDIRDIPTTPPAANADGTKGT